MILFFLCQGFRVVFELTIWYPWKTFVKIYPIWDNYEVKVIWLSVSTSQVNHRCKKKPTYCNCVKCQVLLPLANFCKIFPRVGKVLAHVLVQICSLCLQRCTEFSRVGCAITSLAYWSISWGWSDTQIHVSSFSCFLFLPLTWTGCWSEISAPLR